MHKPHGKSPSPAKPDLARRLTQVRRMVERVEGGAQPPGVRGARPPGAGEARREKRYWQFVQAVLELRPWMGQTVHRHTIQLASACGRSALNEGPAAPGPFALPRSLSDRCRKSMFSSQAEPPDKTPAHPLEAFRSRLRKSVLPQ
jgi:hypothetical protein